MAQSLLRFSGPVWTRIRASCNRPSRLLSGPLPGAAPRHSCARALPVALVLAPALWANRSKSKRQSAGWPNFTRCSATSCEEAKSGYQQPEEDFVRLVDAPSTPSITLDPSERWLLVMGNPPLRTIADLCREQKKLAGIRFDPQRLLPALADGHTDMKLQPLYDADGHLYSVGKAPEVVVEGLPKGARTRSVSWRPDGQGFAFVVLPPDDADSQLPQLWWAPFNPDSPPTVVQAEQLLDEGGNPMKLNALRGSPIQWHPDGRLLLRTAPWPQEPLRKVPQNALRLPAGPSVQTSSPGKKAPAIAWQDLIQTPEDEEEYEFYTTTQLLLYDLETRRARPIGKPDMYLSTIMSPDGKFMLVSMTRRPFSYLVPDHRFARDIEVWSFTPGAEGAERWLVASLPVRDQIPTPRDAVEPFPRNFTWQPIKPHQLRWVEALDGGDPRNKPAADGFRDRVFTLDGPPFVTEQKKPAFAVEMRYTGIDSCLDGTQLISEWRWKDRRYRTWVLPADGSEKWLLYDRSFEDKYGNPGSFETKMDRATRKSFLRQRASDGAFILIGGGFTPRGKRPFVDTMQLKEQPKEDEATKSRAPLNGAKRVWRCVAAPGKPDDPPEEPLQEVGGVIPPAEARREEYEAPAALIGGDGKEPLRLLFFREAQDTPPNLFVRSLDNPEEGEVQITDFPHPQPELKSVRRQLVKYKREDGVELNANLYLPVDYDAEKDGRLPCLMWAYPREFKSANSAGQVGSSPYSFVRGSWSRPLFWILRGYAVLDDPKMPVVGEGDNEPNEQFIEQLSMGARAAVDCVVKELGVADPDRICIGGHSYGAFMTAHLLAHTDLFRAGICRSGAYNRTLTPFGFQSEDRTYWEATETYTKMSPFLYAKQLAEKGAPLLLVHGDDDPNPGTYKMQSERFFAALKGHGATAKLVILPRERHGYVARESILHTLQEQDEWLKQHNAPREAKE